MDWSEDFDTYSDGNFPSDWARRSDGTTGTAVCDTGRAYEGSTSLRVRDPDTGSPSHVHAWTDSYSPSGDHKIEFWGYVGGKNNSGSANLTRIYNCASGGESSDNSTTAWAVDLYDGSDIAVRDGSNWTSIRNGIRHEWVHVIVDVEYSNNRYWVEINGTRYGSFSFQNNGSASDFPYLQVRVDNYTSWVDSFGPPVSTPSAPQNVSATVNANDQITVTWDEPSDWGGEEDRFNVQLIRDGESWEWPAGGTTNVNADGSTSYSETYGPSSDDPYKRVVGIDSSFRFRVRAQNSAGESSYSHSSTVYTDPIPPHNPSVNRPDGTTAELSWSTQSDITSGTVVQYREDTGSGYGSWQYDNDVALNLNGGKDYAAIQSMNYSGSSYSALTIMSWVRTTEDGTIISSFDRSEYWRFGIGSAGTSNALTFNVYDSANGTIQDLSSSTTGTINNGNWHHAAVVFDNGSVTFYIDGSSDGTTSIGSTFGSGTNTRYGFIGAGSEAGSYDGSKGPNSPGNSPGPLNGEVKDFRVYHRALSQSEVQDAMNGNSVDSTGLQFQYLPSPSDIGSGTVTDESGNGYNADLYGHVGWSSDINPSYSHSMNSNSRYQLRIAELASGDDRKSRWVYTDYGNNGNVFFSDDFESGDFSGWDDHTQTDSSYTYVGTSLDGYDGSGRVAESTPPEGDYACQLANGDYVQANLGDLSAESNVIVKAYLQAGSLDSSSENNLIEWYNGSSWQTLHSHGWEHNKQGWYELTALVPSSDLSTDNRVRLYQGGGSGGIGDFLCVDRVVVSDILHEYTTPAAPTDLSSISSGIQELGLSWTDNAAFNDRYETYYKKSSDSSFTKYSDEPADATSATITGLTKATNYDLKTREIIEQPRNGSTNNTWSLESTHLSITTALGTQKIQSSTEALDIPVFDTSEVTNDMVRVQTANGVGALNVVDLANADVDQIRIQTENNGKLGLKSDLEK